MVKLINETFKVNDEFNKDLELNCIDVIALRSLSTNEYLLVLKDKEYKIEFKTFSELSSNPDIFRTHNDQE